MIMKKIIGLFVLLVITTNVFSQYYFDKESAVIDIYSDIRNGNTNSITDFYYWFETNNEKYILAYDADVDKSKWEHDYYAKDPYKSRELILYRFDDNKWVKASNVVQVDYNTFKEHVNFETHGGSKTQCYSKINYRGLGQGMVKVLDNGCVLMFLTTDYKTVDRIHNISSKTERCTCCDMHYSVCYSSMIKYEYNAVVILVPNGDQTYTATRFKPANKITKHPELVVNELLKITESKNEIIIDIWNKEICESEEADSSIIHTYESGRTKEIFYKKKHFTTLRFDIYGTKVCYSGEYNLIEKND